MICQLQIDGRKITVHKFSEKPSSVRKDQIYFQQSNTDTLMWVLLATTNEDVKIVGYLLGHHQSNMTFDPKFRSNVGNSHAFDLQDANHQYYLVL